MQPWISVVVPAFNEEPRLGSSLEELFHYLSRRKPGYEILVVDDGSSDGTASLARSFSRQGVKMLSLPTNKGKGAAVRLGVQESRGEKVLVSDADLSTPIEDLEKLEPYLEHHQVVLGSRSVRDSEIQQRQPFYRETMGRTFNLILHLLGFGGFRDTQCGFKLLDGEAARTVFRDLQVDRFAYDVEMVWRARSLGYSVVEVGVRWCDSPSSRVHPLRDSASMFWDVVKLRLRASRRNPGRSIPGKKKE